MAVLRQMRNTLLLLRRADTRHTPVTWARNLECVYVTTYTNAGQSSFSLNSWLGLNQPDSAEGENGGDDDGGEGRGSSVGRAKDVAPGSDDEEEEEEEVMDEAAAAAASAAAHIAAAAAAAEAAGLLAAMVQKPVVKAGLTNWLGVVRAKQAGTDPMLRRLHWDAVCGFAAKHGVWLHRLCGGSARACAYIAVFVEEVCPLQVRS